MSYFLKGGLMSIASALIAGPALAADLPSTKAPPPPPPPPVFSWQGGYIGAYAGALLGDGSFTLGNRTLLNGAAFVGGGALGYNYQWTDRIVLGAEADFGYRGFIQAGRNGNVFPSSTNAGVLGAFRGRVGFAFAPRWLLFASAGLAYGTNFLSDSVSFGVPLAYGRINNGPTVRPGWTAGAGFEYAWNDKISIKGEYLYAWLADTGVSYATNVGVFRANVTSAGHIVRGGVNYHFAAGGPTAAAVLPK